MGTKFSGEQDQQIQWLGPTGDVESFNEAILPMGGRLGTKVRLTKSGKTKVYQLVQCDSNATAAADVAPASSLAAYWKDKDDFLVTTDRRFCEGAPNNPNAGAGVFRCAVTPGRHCYIQKEGVGECNFHSGTTPAVGMTAIFGAATATGAEFVGVNLGSASTYKPAGYVVEVGGAGAAVDVDLCILD